MSKYNFIFTSESVTEGHPDKVCDQISDAILDAIIAREAELEEQGYAAPDGALARIEDVRCAAETTVTTGSVIVAGEIRTQAYVDIDTIVRDTVAEIGYTEPGCGFAADGIGVFSMIHAQSPDIAMGVDASMENKEDGTDKYDQLGAGDQGIMFGYACDETETLMPLPIFLSHRLAEKLTRVRKDGELDYLRPDGKSQVSVRYENGKAKEVTCVVVSTQHQDTVELEQLRVDIKEKVIDPVIAEYGVTMAEDCEILINPTGRFVIGGPAGDTGVTGRKIIVDTYGGMGRHGGGAFSGKDCTKVDRSAAYAARWVAKNIVAAGLAARCEVELAYAIGVAHPVSIMVDCFGTETVSEELIEKAVGKVFDLRPAAIIEQLDLRRPIYRKTAAYGHFGRELPEFTWEKTDKVEELRKAVADAGGLIANLVLNIQDSMKAEK